MNIFEIPKNQWPDGPWHQEPDYEEFEYKGILCVLNRGPLGAWNGYIAIPKNNKWASRDKSYESGDLDVHGGVTYASDHPPYLHENYKKNKELDLFWIGFDCAHYMDKWPCDLTSINELIIKNITDKEIINKLNDNNSILKRMYENREYRALDYARNECKKLVDQIIQIEYEQS